MKSLEVSIQYGGRDPAAYGVHQRMRNAAHFPFTVLDGNGVVVAEGTVSDRASTRLAIDDRDQNSTLFVRLVWPSGRAAVRQASFGGSQGASVQFLGAPDDVPDWARWANSRVIDAIADSEVADQRSIDRFKNVWLRLWRFNRGEWGHIPLEPVDSEGVSRAKQIELDLGHGSHLLQLGSAAVPWVFVALPAEGVSRVLLTPQQARSPRDLPLRVLVTSGRLEAETLLAFLSQDPSNAAKSMPTDGAVARELLRRKFADVTSAIAGAYFLLRTGRWRDVEDEWFDNLYGSFQWSSDAALIRLVVSLRRGLSGQLGADFAYRLFSQVLARGVPMFAEAHRMMLEASTLLEQVSSVLVAPPHFEGDLRRISELCAARAEMGSAFAFYGAYPDEPSDEREKGAAPEAPLPLKREGYLVTAAFLPSAYEAQPLIGDGLPPKRRTDRRTVTFLKDL